jgi:hypothetical protein
MLATEITGFIIVRDVATNGYPFLEAIFASLELCTTIHVLDGDSQDETWPSLAALREIVGADRLVLHREGWRELGRAHLLAAATNQLRDKLPVPPGCWLWNFQANEVVASETVSEVRQLIRQHRDIDLFRLPFTTFMGFHYRAYTDFRGRLFRNLPELASIGDAYDCGFDLGACRRRPWRLARFVNRRRRRTQGYLAHPVLRFRAPFPEQYPTKLMTRARLNPWDPGATDEAQTAKATLDSVRAGNGSLKEFWERIGFARQSDLSPTGPIPEERQVGKLPSVLHHLSESWRYDPKLSLAALGSMEVPSPPEKPEAQILCADRNPGE